MKVPVMCPIVLGDDGVQLDDKNLNFIYEFQHPFGKDDDAVIFAHRCPADDSLADNPGEVPQRHAKGIIIGHATCLRFLEPGFIRIIGEIRNNFV